jgi:hypothetical protein
MARKAVQMTAQQGAMPGPQTGPSPSEQLYGPPDAQSATVPAPNTPEGTQSQSQQFAPQAV